MENFRLFELHMLIVSNGDGKFPISAIKVFSDTVNNFLID